MSLRAMPFEAGKSYDAGLPIIMQTLTAQMKAGRDDALIFNTGPTGSGKSTLSKHQLEILFDKPDVNQFALTRHDFALAHQRAKEMSLRGEKGYLVYDEAEANRRGSMTEWNRDLLKLYMTNRVFGILHIWNWPSLKLLDRAFVEERVSGVFFCYSKDVDRARHYVFFTKKAIQDMVAAGNSMSHDDLKKAAKKYGYSLGWYKKYDGPLLEAYEQLKLKSAGSIDEEFVEKYSKNATVKSKSACARTLGIDPGTYQKALQRLVDLGSIEWPQVRNPAGHYMIPPEIHERVSDMISRGEHLVG